jgi:hypothetical protein
MSTFNLVVVLDESCSMNDLGGIKVETTLNDYINNFKAKNEETQQYDKVLFSLYRFGTYQGVVTSYKKIDIRDVPDKHGFVPQYDTPLYDGIGIALTDNIGVYGGICHIITDGRENASRNFTREQVFLMIKNMEQHYNWTFQYTGCGSYGEAQSIGINTANTYIYPTLSECSSTNAYQDAYSTGLALQGLNSLIIGFDNMKF